MKKQVVNCATGEVTIIDLTPEEVTKELERSAIAAAKELEPKSLTIEQRLSILEEKVNKS